MSTSWQALSPIKYLPEFIIIITILETSTRQTVPTSLRLITRPYGQVKPPIEHTCIYRIGQKFGETVAIIMQVGENSLAN